MQYIIKRDDKKGKQLSICNQQEKVCYKCEKEKSIGRASYIVKNTDNGSVMKVEYYTKFLYTGFKVTMEEGRSVIYAKKNAVGSLITEGTSLEIVKGNNGEQAYIFKLGEKDIGTVSFLQLASNVLYKFIVLNEKYEQEITGICMGILVLDQIL